MLIVILFCLKVVISMLINKDVDSLRLIILVDNLIMLLRKEVQLVNKLFKMFNRGKKLWLKNQLFKNF